MGGVGGDAKEVKVGPQSSGNAITGGDTGSAPICLGYLGTIDSNGYNCVRCSNQVSETNHWKEGAAEGGR